MSSFILNSTSNSTDGIRRGILKLSNLQYETPLIFQYAVNGSIPHLDWNLCQRYLMDDNAPLVIPFSTCFGMTSYLRSLNLDIRKFCCAPPSRATFISFCDPLKPSPSGFNHKGGVSVWTSSGRTEIASHDFIEIVDVLKPDGYQALCDSDTPVDASKKRISHSVKRTLGYLDQILAQRGDTSCVLFGSLEGGSNLTSRMISVSETKKRPVSGYVFEAIKENLKGDVNLIKAVLAEVPYDKPRAVFGILRPEEIHSLISIGFDIFDSSYATLLSETGKALVIDFNNSITTSSELDLSDKNYKEDFSIISKDCNCYSCCKGFTKGYINHLLNCKEMTATVLLMLHNLHVLYGWINKIKKQVTK